MSQPWLAHIDMSIIHRTEFDLNLLKVFDALMATGSASQAALMLGVSQSAVSHGLARLREIMGDPLFIRTGGRMQPTPRAQRLAEPLRALLEGTARALSIDETFDPATDNKTFVVAASDSQQTALFTGILRDLAVQGYQVTLRLRSLDREAMLDALDAGEIDLAVGFLPAARRWHERRVLHQEDHVCLFNPELVPVRTPISLEDFTRYPHIVPSLRSETTSFVDEALEALGTRRRVMAATTEFLAVPMMLKTAPLIATLPARLARFCANAASLATSPLPFPSPGFEVSMVWHKRENGSPSHAWLRAQFKQGS